MAKRKRQGRSRFGTVIFVLIILGVLGYVGYMIFGNFVQRTAVIASGNLGNQYEARAVIVRNETLTDSEGLTSVKYFADEGELVYKGSKIAEVYSTGYSQTDVNKLLNVRSNIKTQVKAIASPYTDNQLDRLDEQALAHARELGMMVQGKADGNLLNLERQLTSSLSRRQEYLKEKYYSSLVQLYDEETSLIKKIQSWTATYLADRDCIVSFYTDGWENTLTPETYDTTEISQVHSVLAGDSPPMSTAQRGRTSVFRQVTTHGWYLLLLSNDKNWNPVIGQTYKVELQGFEDSVVDGLVTSFARAGNELLVRMSINASVKPVLNVRTASAVVHESYVSGLQVPVNAIRQQGDYTGVVLTDNGGMFVPVTIILQDNNYAVIQPLVSGSLWEGQKIRLF